MQEVMLDRHTLRGEESPVHISFVGLELLETAQGQQHGRKQINRAFPGVPARPHKKWPSVRSVHKRNNKVWNKIGARAQGWTRPFGAHHLIAPIEQIAPKRCRCMSEANLRTGA